MFWDSHRDRLSPCTLAFGCLSPHTAAHRRQAEGCCTAVSWTVFLSRRSRCTGSTAATTPSSQPLEEQKRVSYTITLTLKVQPSLQKLNAFKRKKKDKDKKIKIPKTKLCIRTAISCVCRTIKGKKNHGSYERLFETACSQCVHTGFYGGCRFLPPGQGLMLHMMASTAVPSHALPPYCAGGSLQVRTLVLLP